MGISIFCFVLSMGQSSPSPPGCRVASRRIRISFCIHQSHEPLQVQLKSFKQLGMRLFLCISRLFEMLIRWYFACSRWIQLALRPSTLLPVGNQSSLLWDRHLCTIDTCHTSMPHLHMKDYMTTSTRGTIGSRKLPELSLRGPKWMLLSCLAIKVPLNPTTCWLYAPHYPL